jgi:hypothetical protein
VQPKCPMMDFLRPTPRLRTGLTRRGEGVRVDTEKMELLLSDHPSPYTRHRVGEVSGLAH